MQNNRCRKDPHSARPELARCRCRRGMGNRVIHIKTPAIKLYEQRLRRELPLHQQAGCRDIPALAGEGRPAKGMLQVVVGGQPVWVKIFAIRTDTPVSSKVTATPGARRSRPHRGCHPRHQGAKPMKSTTVLLAPCAPCCSMPASPPQGAGPGAKDEGATSIASVFAPVTKLFSTPGSDAPLYEQLAQGSYQPSEMAIGVDKDLARDVVAGLAACASANSRRSSPTSTSGSSRPVASTACREKS